jgi:ElaB/YqjD/DUF883 family membrane-anchored ribosome-binding protein
MSSRPGIIAAGVKSSAHSRARLAKTRASLWRGLCISDRYHTGEIVMATLTVEETKAEAKAKVMEAVEDAKKAIAKSKIQFDDLKDTATYRIKKAPLASVGLGFGAGILLGALVGIVVTKVAKNKADCC